MNSLLFRRKHRLVHWEDSAEMQAAGSYRPKEDFRLPIITFRLKVDESQEPIYFQFSDSELEEHISMLQKAHAQLREMIEKERT